MAVEPKRFPSMPENRRSFSQAAKAEEIGDSNGRDWGEPSRDVADRHVVYALCCGGLGVLQTVKQARASLYTKLKPPAQFRPEEERKQTWLVESQDNMKRWMS